MNINRKGTDYGTTSGGAISIILKIIYGLYLFMLVEKMLNYDEVKIYQQPNHHKHENNHGFKETDIITYNSVSIFREGYNYPLYYTDETKRYVKMEYQSRFTNWSMSENEAFEGSMHNSTFAQAE